MTRFKRIILEIVAVLLVTWFILGFDVLPLRDWFFSKESIIIYALALGAFLTFLAICIKDKSSKNLEEMIALAIALVNYLLVTWSPFAYSAFLMNKAIPLAALIAALYIIIKNFKDEDV